MAVRIGTSGWQYASWRERFYPSDVRQHRWLEHYSSRFETVEVNNTFYRLPEAGTFDSWANRTPSDFDLSIKASRYLSHIRRLRDPQEAVQRLLTRCERLGKKLGPVLLQLPANFKADPPLLQDVLDAFPTGLRVAFEPRHRSWHTEAVAEVLAAHGAALCLTDTASRHSPIWRTSSWTYVRFHGGRSTPAGCYGRSALHSWAERIAARWTREETCYAYFNNDQHACAVRDALRFANAVKSAGLEPTRVPRSREVSVG